MENPSCSMKLHIDTPRSNGCISLRKVKISNVFSKVNLDLPTTVQLDPASNDMLISSTEQERALVERKDDLPCNKEESTAKLDIFKAKNLSHFHSNFGEKDDVTGLCSKKDDVDGEEITLCPTSFGEKIEIQNKIRQATVPAMQRRPRAINAKENCSADEEVKAQVQDGVGKEKVTKEGQLKRDTRTRLKTKALSETKNEARKDKALEESQLKRNMRISMEAKALNNLNRKKKSAKTKSKKDFENSAHSNRSSTNNLKTVNLLLVNEKESGDFNIVNNEEKVSEIKRKEIEQAAETAITIDSIHSTNQQNNSDLRELGIKKGSKDFDIKKENQQQIKPPAEFGSSGGCDDMMDFNIQSKINSQEAALKLDIDSFGDHVASSRKSRVTTRRQLRSQCTDLDSIQSPLNNGRFIDKHKMIRKKPFINPTTEAKKELNACRDEPLLKLPESQRQIGKEMKIVRGTRGKKPVPREMSSGESKASLEKQTSNNGKKQRSNTELPANECDKRNVLVSGTEGSWVVGPQSSDGIHVDLQAPLHDSHSRNQAENVFAGRCTRSMTFRKENLKSRKKEDISPTIPPKKSRQKCETGMAKQVKVEPLEAAQQKIPRQKKGALRGGRQSRAKPKHQKALIKKEEGVSACTAVSGLKFVGAHCSIAGGVSNAVGEAVSMGAKAFGLFVRNGRTWKLNPFNQEEADKFKAACKEHGYSPHLILPHGSYLLNCGSSNPDVLQKSRDTLVHELKICESLGLVLYNFHPGSACGDGSVEKCIQRIADSINLAHKQTKMVKTVIENMSCQGSTIGGKLEELREIIDKVEDKSRIGVCLDTCHAFAAGFDLSTESGYQKLMADFEAVVGLNYLSGVHLNDSKGDLGCHLDRHENIGKGKIGLAGFRRVMNDPRLADIPMILETPVNDYAAEIRTLYSLESKET